MEIEREIEALCQRGFERIGSWKTKPNRVENSSLLDYDIQNNVRLGMLNEDNILYAFGSDKEVYYIGKTTQSLTRRFVGYCNHGQAQATNYRCNRNINIKLKSGEQVFIYLFLPPNMLQFYDLRINFAAGLEDAFIEHFAPQWNGGEKLKKITETEETEERLAKEESQIYPHKDINTEHSKIHTKKTNR